MKRNAQTYEDLQGQEFLLADLDDAEQALVADLKKRARTKPSWDEFENYWTRKVAAFYDARGVPRKESRHSAVYRIAQDLSGRLAIATGLAKAPDYRDELEEIVRTRFSTRREFCEASGLSEDMLSHVLARRKHMSMETLGEALHRIGYELRILRRETVSRKSGRK